MWCTAPPVKLTSLDCATCNLQIVHCTSASQQTGAVQPKLYRLTRHRWHPVSRKQLVLALVALPQLADGQQAADKHYKSVPSWWPLKARNQTTMPDVGETTKLHYSHIKARPRVRDATMSPCKPCVCSVRIHVMRSTCAQTVHQ